MNRRTLLLATLAAPLALEEGLLRPALGQEPKAPVEPPKEPILRIETGMHISVIKRIGVDAAGKWLVTGSYDKTVRVWEVATGKLVRTLRVPIDEDDEGRINSVAVSPDGAIVAAGGWATSRNTYSLYLFDRESGILTRRIVGLPNVISTMAFSRDGYRLAVGLFGANGVRVFSAASGKLLWQDRAMPDMCTGTDFDGEGRLITTSFDSSLRLYSPEGKLLKKAKVSEGKQPFAARFSPDGSRIAVGYNDVPCVSLLSAAHLSPLPSPSVAGITGGKIPIVSWSHDGRALYGGVAEGEDNRLRRWSEGGAGSFTDLKVSADTIQDIRTLPDGTVAIAASEPRWCLVSADGKQVVRAADSATAKHWLLLGGFQLSPDGGQVAFGYKPRGAEPARFVTAERTLTQGTAPQDFGVTPLTEVPGLNVTDWKNTFAPKLNGKPLALNQHEISRSLAIAP